MPEPAAEAEPRFVPKFGKQPPFFCKNHKEVKATRKCEICHEEYCDACAKMIEDNPKCPDCAAQLFALLPEDQGFPPKTLGQKIKDSFRYPLKGSGVIMLILGGIYLNMMQYAGVYGYAGMIYIWAYYLKVCRTSASGRESPPDWPDMHELGGAQYYVIPKIVAALPALVYLAAFTDVSLAALIMGADESAGGPIYYLIKIAGAVYVPMAILALVLFRSYDVLNPVFVFSSIRKAGRDYVLVFVILIVGECAMGAAVLVTLIASLISMGELGFYAFKFAMTFISMYFMLVEMRVLGDMYYFNQRRLNWFPVTKKEDEPVAAQ